MRGLFEFFRKRPAGRGSNHAATSRRRGQQLGIEVLEPRAMLAVDPLLLPTITFTVSIGNTTGDLRLQTLTPWRPKRSKISRTMSRTAIFWMGFFTGWTNVWSTGPPRRPVDFPTKRVSRMKTSLTSFLRIRQLPTIRMPPCGRTSDVR